MAAGGHGYGEYEFDRCICDKVMACTSGGDGGGTTKNIISPKFSNFGDIIKQCHSFPTHHLFTQREQSLQYLLL